ncbi:MAG: hypothetical protein R3B49_11660 [Phycisphaerales bacterium]
MSTSWLISVDPLRVQPQVLALRRAAFREVEDLHVDELVRREVRDHRAVNAPNASARTSKMSQPRATA